MFLPLLMFIGIAAVSCNTKEKPAFEEETTVIEQDSLIPGTDSVAV